MIPPRREFLKTTAAAAAAIITSSPSLRAGMADDQSLRIGFIGCGGMGGSHLKVLSKRRDVQIAWVCDVDAERLAAAAKLVEDRRTSATHHDSLPRQKRTHLHESFVVASVQTLAA